jgi:hypothetical protein
MCFARLLLQHPQPLSRAQTQSTMASRVLYHLPQSSTLFLVIGAISNSLAAWCNLHLIGRQSIIGTVRSDSDLATNAARSR